MDQQENEYVSLVMIPRKWFKIFVWIFSVLVIVNLGVEIFFSWNWDILGNTTLTRTSVLMTLIVGFFFIISHIWEAIMLGYAKLFKQRLIDQGKAEAYREIDEWYQRKEKAESRGEKFTEPPPFRKKNPWSINATKSP